MDKKTVIDTLSSSKGGIHITTVVKISGEYEQLPKSNRRWNAYGFNNGVYVEMSALQTT